jgi:hypothetical protein
MRGRWGRFPETPQVTCLTLETEGLTNACQNAAGLCHPAQALPSFELGQRATSGRPKFFFSVIQPQCTGSSLPCADYATPRSIPPALNPQTKPQISDSSSHR